MPSRSELAPSDAQWIGDLVKDAADQLFRMRDAGLAGKVHLDMGDLRLVMYGIASAVHNRRAASGWVSAPMEPTEAMLDAVADWMTTEHAKSMWKDMLSAIPSPPAGRKG